MLSTINNSILSLAFHFLIFIFAQLYGNPMIILND